MTSKLHSGTVAPTYGRYTALQAVNLSIGSICMVRLSEVSAFWMEDSSSSVVISGAWLRNFGFEPGRKIVVDITKGQIVIKLVEAIGCEGVEVGLKGELLKDIFNNPKVIASQWNGLRYIYW